MTQDMKGTEAMDSTTKMTLKPADAWIAGDPATVAAETRRNGLDVQVEREISLAAADGTLLDADDVRETLERLLEEV